MTSSQLFPKRPCQIPDLDRTRRCAEYHRHIHNVITVRTEVAFYTDIIN